MSENLSFSRDWAILNKAIPAWNKSISKDLADQLFLKTLPLMIKFRQFMGHHYRNGLDFSVSAQIFFHGWLWILLLIVRSKTWTRFSALDWTAKHPNVTTLNSPVMAFFWLYIPSHLRHAPGPHVCYSLFYENISSLLSKYFFCTTYIRISCVCIYLATWDAPHVWHHFLLWRYFFLREAIVQKIPEFYEIISQTGRGGQSDFISLIQK